MNLKNRLDHLDPNICPSSWSGYEHYKGYGVMMLPFSSGHLLGLRVFPENDFAPYSSVWHCNPQGEWSIYNDGPSLKTTCPRWWGPALTRARLAQIEIDWIGANKLQVNMKNPPLEWVMEMTAPIFLKILNTVSRTQPLRVWKFNPILKAAEWLARHFLKMGDVQFSFITPSDQETIFIPEQNFFIRYSHAQFEGKGLGHPVKLKKNPAIGNVLLPNQPVFFTGQAHARIRDTEEYRRTKQEIKTVTPTDLVQK